MQAVAEQRLLQQIPEQQLLASRQPSPFSVVPAPVQVVQTPLTHCPLGQTFPQTPQLLALSAVQTGMAASWQHSSPEGQEAALVKLQLFPLLA